MKVEVNESEILAVKKMLGHIKNGGVKALTTATNQTIRTTRVQWRKAIGQDLALTAERINQDMTDSKANYTNIAGSVSVMQKKNPSLGTFKPRQTKTGVVVKPWKKKPAWFVRGAFLVRLHGNKHVALRDWSRKHAPKRPVKKAGFYAKLPKKYRKSSFLRGPSPYDAAGHDSLYQPLFSKSGDLLQKNMSKAADDLIRRSLL